MVRRAFLVLGFFWLAPGLAQGALKGENLLVPPMPAGWKKSYEGSGNGIDMVAYVPANESADAWTQQITIAVYGGHNNAKPRDLQQIVTNGLGQNCEALHVEDRGAGTISGLPAGRWVTYCSRLKQLNLGEITFHQAVGGHSHLFLVQRTWRGNAFDISRPPIDQATIGQWEQYFNQAAVCDSADPGRPCP